MSEDTDHVPQAKSFDWALSDDGKSMRLIFRAETGEAMALYLGAQELTGLISRLIALGVESGKRSAPPADTQRPVAFEPIPVSQMGIGPVPKDATSVALMMRTGILELVFQVDAAMALETLQKLEQVSTPTGTPLRS